MKKMIMVLMIAFTMMTGLFADVTLLPKDTFNNCIVPAYEDTCVQPLIAYVADTWEDVYEKTGVDKYDWKSIDSTYCDCKYQYFLIVIVRVEDTGKLGWICYEFPGDGAETMYVADPY